MTSGRYRTPARPDAARGAALLAFMLTLIAGAAWFLLSDLNRHRAAQARQIDSRLALHQAKQALLDYAMNYPELRANPDKGPGFLPCPDQNNDGRPESNCAASTGTTLGRLPFSILGLDDPRDSSGERLWYALSPQFRNVQSNHTVINSETPGQLSVDGIDDVVAVVLAPGAPVAEQYRRPGNAAADYLEGVNASIADGRFSTEAGNDQLAVISRAQLMAAVERRVLNETRAILAHYRAEHSAYPALAPFADPEADHRILRGTHTGNNNSGTLTDRRRNFIEAGVSAYDRVRNVTDGSVAVVKTVNRRSLILFGQSLGVENDFDRHDVYFIEQRGLVGALQGVAGSGSSGLMLKDRTKDFRELNIVPGDIVENLSDGSRGAVRAVSRTALTLAALNGGVENDFDVGEGYRLRSNVGRAGFGSAELMLADPTSDFIARGILSGDLVENLSDGSSGRVDNIFGPGSLSLSGLDFGRHNVFGEHDVYRFPRYNATLNLRKGLLPVHTPGQRFPTGFGVAWSMTGLGGWVINGLAADASAEYAAALRQALESSAGVIDVNAENGSCVWLNPQVVDCIGLSATRPVAPDYAGAEASHRRYRFRLRYQGDVIARGSASPRQRDVCLGYGSDCAGAAAGTHIPFYDTGLGGRAGSGTQALTLQDAGVDFRRYGVAPGATVFNTTDGSAGMVAAVGRHSLRLSALAGGVDNDLQPGDRYRIGATMVIIEDLLDGQVVTRAGLSILPGGATGSVRTTGIDYYLSEESGELPSWFLRNRWHHLIYAAYSAAGNGHCNPGLTCLAVPERREAPDALVVSAGMALAGQDRSSGAIADYYEGQNASLYEDDIFSAAGLAESFNDQLVVITP